MIRFAVVAGFLALNFYVYNFLASEAVIPPREEFVAFPDQVGSWACQSRQKIDDDVLANLGATDYIVCDFRSADFAPPVGVYVGYHATQVREEGGGAGENSIHPPAHCLPGSGWDVIDAQLVPLAFPGIPGGEATVNRLVIAKGELRQVVYYWYQSRGRVISRDWQKIVYVGIDRALQGRTDGSLVRYTAPVRQNEIDQADAAIRDVAARVGGELPRFVPN